MEQLANFGLVAAVGGIGYSIASSSRKDDEKRRLSQAPLFRAKLIRKGRPTQVFIFDSKREALQNKRLFRSNCGNLRVLDQHPHLRIALHAMYKLGGEHCVQEWVDVLLALAYVLTSSDDVTTSRASTLPEDDYEVRDTMYEAREAFNNALDEYRVATRSWRAGEMASHLRLQIDLLRRAADAAHDTVANYLELLRVKRERYREKPFY